ncbi:unnamed protein product [Moneuplotes crassus]|uniref:Uncharacterized protein n=1 Tax=Euplotes crassus TaxID=5936 RepID=A0AAD1X908_EUPCR|nr:unnamed protein product [Moneuplotes crassus]
MIKLLFTCNHAVSTILIPSSDLSFTVFIKPPLFKLILLTRGTSQLVLIQVSTDKGKRSFKRALPEIALYSC